MYDSEVGEVWPFLFGLAGSFGAEGAENGLVFLVQSIKSAEVLTEQFGLVELFRAETEVKLFICLVEFAEDVSNLRLNLQRFNNDLLEQGLINLGKRKLLEPFDLDKPQCTLSEVFLTMSSLLLGFSSWNLAIMLSGNGWPF